MAEVTDVNVADLIVCGACCCSISSLFCKFPDCLGCKVEGICCCCQVEQGCCKCINPGAANEQKCVVCLEGGTYCVAPTTCCQEQAQVCFLDVRGAFPCTEKVPCLCTCLPFCVIWADGKCTMQCCKKGSDLIPSLGGPKQVVVSGVVLS
mmetsp:Transcript_79584/g.184733  ORF Transcript_79584/g.184733 Transcript_79584/m.184733 type:complete len:150 (+) Transcript_79584:86-535(+)